MMLYWLYSIKSDDIRQIWWPTGEWRLLMILTANFTDYNSLKVYFFIVYTQRFFNFPKFSMFVGSSNLFLYNHVIYAFYVRKFFPSLYDVPWFKKSYFLLSLSVFVICIYPGWLLALYAEVSFLLFDVLIFAGLIVLLCVHVRSILVTWFPLEAVAWPLLQTCFEP